jgi:hypothetical protein
MTQHTRRRDPSKTARLPSGRRRAFRSGPRSSRSSSLGTSATNVGDANDLSCSTPPRLVNPARPGPKAGVALVPGAAFGDDRYARMSYATSDDVLEAAIRKMAAAIKSA